MAQRGNFFGSQPRLPQCRFPSPPLPPPCPSTHPVASPPAAHPFLFTPNFHPQLFFTPKFDSPCDHKLIFSSRTTPFERYTPALTLPPHFPLHLHPHPTLKSKRDSHSTVTNLLLLFSSSEFYHPTIPPPNRSNTTTTTTTTSSK